MDSKFADVMELKDGKVSISWVNFHRTLPHNDEEYEIHVVEEPSGPAPHVMPVLQPDTVIHLFCTSATTEIKDEYGERVEHLIPADVWTAGIEP